MNANELERVKQDIATIKQAAGLELPFGWETVWIHMIGLPVAGLWCLLYWWIFHRPSVVMILAAAILLQVVDRCVRLKYKRSGRRPAIKGRAYKVAVYGAAVLGVVIAQFMVLAMIKGIDTYALASGMITMAGLVAALAAFQRKESLSVLGLAIPATLVGISIAVWPTADAIVRNACIAMFVAGPATAFIQMHQLRQHGRTNDPD